MASAGDAVVTMRDRLRAAPGALQELGEQTLDLAVRHAVASPLDLHTADDVARALRDRPADTQGATGLVLGWLSGRLATRVLRIGTRFAIPMRVLLMAAPPLVQAMRRGTFEVHALASLLVNRLRHAGMPVDARAVRRVVLGAYLWPDEVLDPLRERPTAPARLAWTWVSGAVDSHEERAVRAAQRLDALDLEVLAGR